MASASRPGSLWIGPVITLFTIASPSLLAAAQATKQQLQQQISELEAVRIVTAEQRVAAVRRTWGATDTAISRDAWNTYFGLLLGRAEKIEAFQQTTAEAEIAYESGHGAIATTKTLEAIKQLKNLVQTQVGVLVPEIDPKIPTNAKEALEFVKAVADKVKQVGKDAKSLFEGLGAAGEAMQKSEDLNALIAEIDRQISDRFDQMKTAPDKAPSGAPPQK